MPDAKSIEAGKTFVDGYVDPVKVTEVLEGILVTIDEERERPDDTACTLRVIERDVKILLKHFGIDVDGVLN